MWEQWKECLIQYYTVHVCRKTFCKYQYRSVCLLLVSNLVRLVYAKYNHASFLHEISST
jgi:hypothetical protein